MLSQEYLNMKRKRQENQWCNMRKAQLAIVDFEHGRRPQAKESWQLREVWKGKEKFSPRDFRKKKKNQSGWYLDFIPKITISDFWPTEL